MSDSSHGRHDPELPGPSQSDSDVDDELLFHLRSLVDENMNRGMSREEAWNDAQSRFGSLRQYWVQCRGAALARRRIVPGVLAAAAVFGLVVGWLIWEVQSLRSAHKAAQRAAQAQGSIPDPAAEHGDLVGRVVDRRGEPIAGADVLIVVKTWPGGWFRQDDYATKSDREGRYRLEKLVPPDGQCAVQVAALRDGYALTSSYQLKEADDETALAPAVLELDEALPITLVVSDVRGRPVPGACVVPLVRRSADGQEHLLYFQGSQPAQRASDAEGEVPLHCLQRGDSAEIYVRIPDGEWTLHAIEVPREGQRIEVSAGQTAAGGDTETSQLRKQSPLRMASTRSASRDPALPKVRARNVAWRAQDDVADVPARELRADGDSKKRYFLIGAADEQPAPEGGYKLLFVLPGGDGGEGFHPFVKRIYKHVLGEGWLIAEPVAPEWDKKQFDRIVWPTAKSRYPAAKFTTEAFVAAILKDVRSRTKLNARGIFMLGWSSGGPPVYATTLVRKSPIRGAFVAMSIFIPGQLPPLAGGKDKAFYLLQSPDDRATKFFFAERAEKALEAAGAKVKLEPYPGGHGWRGDVYGMLRAGIEWLDENAAGN